MVAALDAIGSDASKGAAADLPAIPCDPLPAILRTLSASRAGGMRAVLGLHENVCTGAADGFARMQRGSPPLVLLHLGPGLGNGLANLHNAHRARSPMVVMVGDMAARKRSNNSSSSSRVGQHTLPQRPPLAPLPTAHREGGEPQGLAEGEQGEGEGEGEGEEGVQLLPGMVEFVEACAAALKQCARGKAVLYLAGEAALQAGGALHAAGLVAAATGASLMCENAFARVDRGAGLPVLTRLPYFPQESEQALSKFDMVVVVDAKLPVASFGYRDGPSQLLPASMVQRDAVWELDMPPGAPPGTVAAALKLLARQVAPAHDIIPGRNCGGVFAPPTPSRPPLPPPGTRLSPPVLCTVVAALQPPDCILVDESLTSGVGYWDLSKGCPTFTHMTLTGGAIGSGPPMALGAALACPGRRVINLQADGSAMYSVQALWSQAREMCDITTIICANSSYAILKVECARQRLPTPGAATRSLTDLGHPAIDWVALAAGMGVPGVRVTTAGELEIAMRKSLESKGPMLIQAML
ncbi:hypothetical protein QJQ45_026522 [Haematococcus lacustris]|nr:hypothetical protein QJQ45_026522 [Haematococcus lacustris]